MKKVKIALLGLGTVGSGVINILEMNKNQISKYYDVELEIVKILVNDVTKKRDVQVDRSLLTNQIEDILNLDVDIVIEVMGGIDQTFKLIEQCLNRKIHVITANKDMLAAHLEQLENIATKNKVALKYEASIAGGIPIVNAINAGLSANVIHHFMGIFNGTSNFILSKMTNDRMQYDEALALATKLGYAELDPTNDVEGIDAARKVAISCYLAFNQFVHLDEVSVSGISDVTLEHIEIAKALGYRIKLIGSGAYDGNEVVASVHPTCIPMAHQLAHVEDEYNAIYIEGNAVGDTMYYGKGAGSLATGSAVVSDLLYIIERFDSNHTLPLHLEVDNVQHKSSLVKEEKQFLVIINASHDNQLQEEVIKQFDFKQHSDCYYAKLNEAALLALSKIEDIKYMEYRIEGE